MIDSKATQGVTTGYYFSFYNGGQGDKTVTSLV